MNFTSQICTTKEQSERLLALGLKKETADMYTTDMSSKGINYTDDWKIGSIPYCNAISFLNSQGLQLEKTAWSIIPTWSLHRLLEMMPTYIDVIGDEWTLNILQGKLIAYTTDENDDFLFAQGAISLYDSIITAIEWLIQAEHFNKEYLCKL